jgi:hypothetical protein
MANQQPKKTAKYSPKKEKTIVKRVSTPKKTSISVVKTTVQNFPREKQEAIQRANEIFNQNKDKSNIQKAAKKLINFLNLIPAFILVISNVIAKNKHILPVAVLFVKLFIETAKKKEIVNNQVVDITKLDRSEKTFLKDFSEIFMKVYTNTDPIDRGIVALSFIDLIRNEIPLIVRKTHQTNYINDEKIFIGILENAKELSKTYDRTSIANLKAI